MQALMTAATLTLVLAAAEARTLTMNSVELAATLARPLAATSVADLPTRAMVSVFWTRAWTVPPTPACSPAPTEKEMGRSLASFWAVTMTSPPASTVTLSATSAL